MEFIKTKIVNFLCNANKKRNNYNDSLLQPPPLHLPSTRKKKMRDCFKLIYDFKNDLTCSFHTQTHTRTYACKNTRPLYSVLDEMHCAVWYHFYSLKNVRNKHGAVLLLVKLQSNTPPRVFSHFLNCTDDTKPHKDKSITHKSNNLVRLFSAKYTAKNDLTFWNKIVTNLELSCLEICEMQ